MTTLTEISENLYHGKHEDVSALVEQALDEGITASRILSDGLLPGMDQVGQDFKAGDMFIPEVLVAARAMTAGMDLIKPLLKEGEAAIAGKVVIGTVRGDLHDIGKNLVRMMLEGGGFEVVDLGIDVGPAQFAEAVREHNPDIIGLSALLTTTMSQMKSTIVALEDIGLREGVKVIVGGAPVTDAYAEEIGADGYAPDAATAVDLARTLQGA